LEHGNAEEKKGCGSLITKKGDGRGKNGAIEGDEDRAARGGKNRKDRAKQGGEKRASRNVWGETNLAKRGEKGGR